eukprot:GGOE01018231.1.p2 GENE.GGOE01018231.1~~GGOE01018231.1.p2  ORF type:complete len:165 (+),score=52.56 GGOE01018231.1:54-497(+)
MEHHHHHKMGAVLGAAGGFELAEHNGGGVLGDLAGAGVGGVLGSMAEQGLYNQFSSSSGGQQQGMGDPYNQYGQNQYGQYDPSMGYDAPAPKHHHKLGNVAGAVAGYELGEKMDGGFFGDLAGAGIGAWAGGALEGKLRDGQGGGFF